MEEQSLKVNLEHVIDALMTKIHILNMNSENKITKDIMYSFQSIITDLSVLYENVLLFNQFKSNKINLVKLNNLMDYIYITYKTDFIVVMEIISIDLLELLKEIKGYLNQ